jgi:two-component system chemotaxis response regulator CheB
MPREAFLIGAIDEQCSLDHMTRRVLGAVAT